MTTDQTLRLLRDGYACLSGLRHDLGTDVFDIRLFGMPVTCLTGPEDVPAFYDPARFVRQGALPTRVRHTLVGDGGVQGLDDGAHRHRKALFMALMTPDRLAELRATAAAEWGLAVQRWRREQQVVLFDEAALVLTRAVCGWAGVPLPAVGASVLARNLVAMVDAFGAAGPRHWRGRVARRRTERWAARVVEDVRREVLEVPEGSPATTAAWHRDRDGLLLPREVAAVELLNVIRPTVAISWYVAFAAHALHHHARWRHRITESDAPARWFTQEVRRFYPFTPFVGARAAGDQSWRGHHLPAGRLTLLDVYGLLHDPASWPEPGRFDPERFDGAAYGPYDFIPQGGGDPDSGHRCAGEQITVQLLEQAVRLLAGLTYHVPPQDLGYPLRRIPTRPRSGVVIERVGAGMDGGGTVELPQRHTAERR